MAATAFIRLLESRGLLDPEIVSELNRQVESSKVRVTPEAIAKLLVENGQLTRFQATKLITELNETLDRSATDPSLALRGGRPLDEPAFNDHDSVEDLLPDDYVANADVVEEVDVVEAEVSDADDAVVIDESNVTASSPLKSELDYGDLPRPVVKGTVKSTNSWESFRILGVGFFLLLLLVALIPLVWWVMQGSANEAYEKALAAYEARDYEKSAKEFTAFAAKFPRDDKTSEARVRAVLSLIREDAEKVADPSVSVETAKKNLPSIASEDALSQLRTDLADMLLRMAEKFIARIDSAPSLDDKKLLLEHMGDHMTLIKDPRYLGAQERTQNALRIQNIEEGQSRAARDIQRGVDLLAAIESISQSNAEKNVNKSYETRRELVRRYPALESDEKLNSLIADANVLQKDLVVAATQQPTLTTEPPATNIAARVVLASRTGAGDPTNSDPVFVRVLGSLVAFKSGDGSILWRQFIGNDWTGEPQPIPGESDVLVHFPERNSVQRIAGIDGKLVWEAKFEQRVHKPQIDGSDIFVSTNAGEVFCLDGSSGITKWGKKFPQPIDASVAGANGKRRRYVVGSHSNIYAVSRAGGECEEVEYLGHNPGTITIPPLWIMNHLIVFENAGPDYAFLKVLTTNDEGLDLQPSSQLPIRFKGHFVVEPQVDGRRFAVTTNLGEVSVFEVDTASTRDKVQRMAGSIEKETEPRVNWPLMVGADLYLASNRLAMYQIQVSSQKLNRSWQKEDGDLFTGRPIRTRDAIVHSRIVRGNLGVRVTAINPQTGDPIWETDVGVPTTAIAGKTGQWTAMTAQGSLFAISSEVLKKQSPVSQFDTPGRNQRLTRFDKTAVLQDGRLVAFNSAKEDQMLLIDPSKNKSGNRLIAIDFGSAVPSNEVIAIGNLVVVPLSNAHVVLVDPDKAQIVGKPFQPEIAAGESPRWLNPVLLSDNQSIVIADERRSIYKVATGRQLKIVLQQNLERPLKGRLSVLGNTVVVASANDSGDQLDFYDAAELKLKSSMPVEGRFAWGPFSVTAGGATLALAQSEIEGLIAVDEMGKRKWTLPLDKVEMRGAPIGYEDDIIAATTSGDILRISTSDGSIVGTSKAGEPVSIAPTIVGAGMLVPTEEGALLTLPVPTRSQ